MKSRSLPRMAGSGGEARARAACRWLAVLALLAAGCVSHRPPPGSTREDWLAEARRAEAEGKNRIAEGLYRLAAGQDAEPDARGNSGLADNLAARGKWKDALPFYARAYELAGGNPHLLNNWAVCILRAGGDPAEALDLAQRACRWAPGNPYYLDTLAEALLAIGEPGAAAKILEKAVERARDDRVPVDVRRQLLERLFLAWLEAGNETLAWQAATARDRLAPDVPWPRDLRKKWRALQRTTRPLRLFSRPR